MLNPTPVNMQAVPNGLERYRQFINWRLVPDKANPGEFKKLPCDVQGNIINSHDPSKWMSAEEAAMSPHGIAFVFAQNDPFWFLDLDDAFQDGQWSQLAQWAIQTFAGCAAEISHSGKGLHLFGAGSHCLPIDHGCKNAGLGVELYTTGRFVALTGTQKTGTAWIDFSDRLPGFVATCGLKPRELVEDLGEDEGVDPRYTGPEDDDALIALMLGATGSMKAMFGAKASLTDLWERNVPVLELAIPSKDKRDDGMKFDWSAADASLMWHLSFWTGRDRARMVRLFERSALYRDHKYEGKGAYRLPLLLKQGFRNPGVYDRPRPGAAAAPVSPGAVAPSLASVVTERGGRSTMDLPGQVEHFKGCVYVEAAHAIMVPAGRLLNPARFNAVYGGFSFQMQFDNGKPTQEAFRAFTENRMFRFPTAIDTCFRPDRAPGEMIDGRVNTWRKPEVDEKQGDIAPFVHHMKLLFPNPNDLRIILAYMQSLARNPGVKFQWAPVIQGTEGNGKSLIIRCLYHAVTKDYSHLPKASQLTEKFNSWLENRIFIGVEEIKVTDRREVLEDLKDAVTNDWIEIRGMNREKKMADNFTNWIFLTNHKDAIPVTRDQRRYAIFYTAQQSVDDLKRDGMTGKYFTRLYDWLKKEGGYQAVAHWLRHAPIEAVEYDPSTVCQRAPATSSTVEAIAVSLGKVEQSIMEAVENETPGFRGDWISTGAVRRWLQTQGVRDVSPRKMGDILKSLGYEHRFKSSISIAEEGGNRSMIYRKLSVEGGTQNDFLIAQNYHGTLRGGNFTIPPIQAPLIRPDRPLG